MVISAPIGAARVKMVNTRTVASTAVFTAFVAAATMAFSLAIPVTGGYFNVGEIMVYTAALLMGPYVGAFAGGAGSMLSDVLLGFGTTYAPGTLIIKGTEGFIVGYLSKRAMNSFSRRAWRVTSAVLAVGVGALVGALGVEYLTGPYQLYLGFPVGPQGTVNFSVPAAFWVVLGAAVFVAILAAGFSVDEKVGWTTLAVLLGGAEMVAGYFLYESLVLRLGYVSAAGEVPFNIAQAVVGLLVAVPLSRSIRRIAARSPQVSRG